MTSRRRMPFGKDRDAARIAASPALTELRTELLVMPREPVVEQHIEMMMFEQQLLATPRFVRTRAALPKPRRAAFVFLAVFATLASCGLSAAGALPGPLQQITETIARSLGVPQAHHAPHHASHAAAAAPPVKTTPSTGRPAMPYTAPSTTVHHPAVVTHPAKHQTSHPSAHTPKVSGQAIPSSPPKIVKARPTTRPTKRIIPKQAGPPPSKYNTNTPAGYPADWRKRAIAAATQQLQACALATTLSQSGCPQEATAAGNAQPQSVLWKLLNDPQDGAVVVAQVHRRPSGQGGPATTVTVYEPFQMDALYTVDGAARPFLAYSSGIAQATMTWGGSSFEHVSFSPGSAAGHLLPGVTMTPFQRPADVTDAPVLVALQTGFNACTSITPPLSDPIPSCPQPAASDPTAPVAQWSLVGDPTQGAVVAFDGERGVFTVTGTYAMTSSDGAAVNGSYTATLVSDGGQLRVLSIIGS